MTGIVRVSLNYNLLALTSLLESMCTILHSKPFAIWIKCKFLVDRCSKDIFFGNGRTWGNTKQLASRLQAPHRYQRWPNLNTAHQRGSEPSQDRCISLRLHQATSGILEWHSQSALINLSTCKYAAWISAQRKMAYRLFTGAFCQTAICLEIPKSPLRYHLAANYEEKGRSLSEVLIK